VSDTSKQVGQYEFAIIRRKNACRQSFIGAFILVGLNVRVVDQILFIQRHKLSTGWLAECALCSLNRNDVRIIKTLVKISSAAAMDRTICYQRIAQYQFAINSAAPRSPLVSFRVSFGACEDLFAALAAHRPEI